MAVHLPDTVDEAVECLAAEPSATLLAGGTDLMVEVNDGHRRPSGSVVVVNRIPELRSWRHDPMAGSVTIGAAVSYREMLEGPMASMVPALAQAARTVGSPQIRNVGTLGGNLGTCSPAGDGLPVLSALDAVIELASVDGRRRVSVGDFMVGVKRTALAPGELIVSITVPVVDGWQGYAKVGVRNAMVIAVASVCVVLDRADSSVGVALGSVGPTILRCPDAEEHLAASLDWATLDAAPADLDRFASLVSAASRPITDHRSSAEYRRHAVGVLARRLVRRASARGVAA
ncbi:MAG TPA: xanthine dehydrogenase family protein subunit M [Ilumatobacteraceae bacterium]|nr:xanthine dehydrogenase family protein subunit M [Ilumatobacteraceae bacterium]